MMIGAPKLTVTTVNIQMMMHLEIRVDDLESAVAHSTACRAALATFQPQENVRVCIGPAGHPFCLWLG